VVQLNYEKIQLATKIRAALSFYLRIKISGSQSAIKIKRV